MPDAPSDTLTLSLDGWEGPLDLLLALARTQKVDLREISILALVEQYLAFMRAAEVLQLERAADYLVMAAWLAFLKSALLLPRAELPDPDPETLASQLQHRLRRLDAMREAAARLTARDRIGRDVFTRGAPEGLAVVPAPAWRASLYDLLAGYGAVVARGRPVVHIVARRPVMTLDQAITRITTLLAGRDEWRTLESLLPPAGDASYRRSALASSFVATLELARQGRVALAQEGAFAPLLVRAE